ELTLSVSDRRDQVDRSARELRTTLGGPAGLHEQLSLGIRRRERIELGPASSGGRIPIVDPLDLDYRGSAALIDADGRFDEIRATQGELPDDGGGDVRIAGFGEVTIGGTSDEARIARRLEPAACLCRGDDL